MQGIKTACEYSEYEKKLREYYWKCFASEFSKTLIFFLFFLSLGLGKEFLVALVVMLLLRGNGGGLHCKHYLSCLLVSFSFLCGSIFLALYVHPQKYLVCICTLLCAILGYFLVPITSSNRPLPQPEQIKKSKRTTVSIILAMFILICICPYTVYLNIGFWTLILHISQLLIAYIMKEVKKNVQVGH